MRRFPADAPATRRVCAGFASRRATDAAPARRPRAGHAAAMRRLRPATRLLRPARAARRFIHAAAARRDRARRDRRGAQHGVRAHRSSSGRTAFRQAGGATAARSTATCPPRGRRARRCRFRAAQRGRCAALPESNGRGRAGAARARRAGCDSVPSDRVEQAKSNIASKRRRCWKLLEWGVAPVHRCRAGSIPDRRPSIRCGPRGARAIPPRSGPRHRRARRDRARAAGSGPYCRSPAAARGESSSHCRG